MFSADFMAAREQGVVEQREDLDDEPHA